MIRQLFATIALTLLTATLAAQDNPTEPTPRPRDDGAPKPTPRVWTPGEPGRFQKDRDESGDAAEPNIDNVIDPRMREHLKTKPKATGLNRDVLRAIEARRRALNLGRGPGDIPRPTVTPRPGAELTKPEFGLPDIPRPATQEDFRDDPTVRLDAPRPGYDRDSPVPTDTPGYELPDLDTIPRPQRPNTGSRGYDSSRIEQLEREYENNRITRELNITQRDPAQMHQWSNRRFDSVDPAFGRYRSQGTYLDSPYSRGTYGLGGALNSYKPYTPTFNETLSPRRLDSGRLTSPDIRPDPRSSRSPYGFNPSRGLNPGSDYRTSPYKR